MQPIDATRRERLRELIDEAGSAAALAKKAGKSPAQISQWLTAAPDSKNGRPRTMSADSARMLERVMGKQRGWMDNKDLPVAVFEEAPYLPGFEHLSIPVLAQAGSMGGGVDVMHDEVVVGRLTVSPQWITDVVKPTKPENLRFIHGYGDSMEPTFTDGDVLLVDIGIRDPRIDGVYVLEANERIYIKRVRQRIDGVYEISSDNPTVKTVDVLDGKHVVHVHGRVVWAWNGKKM